MDRLASMAVFVKSAQTGSFATAAAALGLSSHGRQAHPFFRRALRHASHQPDHTSG
jgi:hypothetical protein